MGNEEIILRIINETMHKKSIAAMAKYFPNKRMNVQKYCELNAIYKIGMTAVIRVLLKIHKCSKDEVIIDIDTAIEALKDEIIKNYCPKAMVKNCKDKIALRKFIGDSFNESLE